MKYNLLFERFLAPERDGPPDIDLDIESDRREEAIQYVYEKLRPDLRRAGRQRHHLPGRSPRSATWPRRWATPPASRTPGPSSSDRWGPLRDDASEERDHDIPADVLDLAGQLEDFPRHLGIHSGGMVICDRPVSEVCPVEWARMDNRSRCCSGTRTTAPLAGLVKFDLLGLGMLSALHYAVDLVAASTRASRSTSRSWTSTTRRSTTCCCRADSVGVFQVECRAQMATLPRLKPREFYDLVVEVALIRPGPIQGGSVHPYIRRRNGRRSR